MQSPGDSRRRNARFRGNANYRSAPDSGRSDVGIDYFQASRREPGGTFASENRHEVDIETEIEVRFLNGGRDETGVLFTAGFNYLF